VEVLEEVEVVKGERPESERERERERERARSVW